MRNIKYMATSPKALWQLLLKFEIEPVVEFEKHKIDKDRGIYYIEYC